MIDLGKVKPGSTLRIPFSSFDKDDGSSITMTNFAVADILVYKDGSTTERASTASFTATTDFDAKTGKHLCIITLSDNTTAGFFAAGSEYLVAIDAVTVDGVTTGGWIARFCIGYEGSMLDTTIATLSSQTSFTLTDGPAEDDALNDQWCIIHDVASAVQVGKAIISDYTGSTKTVTLAAGTTFTAAATDNISIMGPMPMQPTVAARKLDVSTGGEAGIDWANVGSPTTTLGLTGTTIATTQKVDVETIKTNPVVNGGTLTFPSGATLASTTNITAGTITTVTNLTNAPTSGDLTATMKTSVTTAATAATPTAAAVTGAVGSVTGNVGGNVTGSVGSVVGAVGSVTGNVGGSVVGSVASVTAGVTLANGAHGGAAATLQLGSTSSTPALLIGNTGGNAAKITGSYTAGGSAANSALLIQHTGVGAPVVAFDGEDDVTLITTAGAISAPILALGSGAITAAAVATGAIDADALAADAGTEIGTAVWATAARTLTAATNITSTGGTTVPQTGDSFAIVNSGTHGNSALNTDIDAIAALVAASAIRTAVGLASANLDTQLADIPTVAEFEARTLVAADYTIVSDLGVVQTADHTAAIADLPTNAELATALGTADDATLAAIAALNNISAAQVLQQAKDALVFYDLDHLLAADYDPASKPGVATALLNELIESDAGVSRFTINALENAPSGSGASAADIADAVWDEAIAGHNTAGTFGATNQTSGSGASAADIADAVWDEAIAGHNTAGTFGATNQTSGSGDTVVIGPVAATVSEASIASSTGGTKYPLTLFQNTAATVVIAVTDGDGDPLTMTGNAFKVVVHQTDGTVIREFNSADEAAQFTLANSGATGGTNDQLTVGFLTTDTATAGVYQWELRNTTLGVVLVSGRFEVNTAPNP